MFQESAVLLATSYRRLGLKHKSLRCLRGCENEKPRFLLAQICFELEMYDEAEEALCDQGAIAGGAGGRLLLGQICKRTDRIDSAIENFRTAASLDPFLWSAHEELCRLGAEAEAKQAADPTCLSGRLAASEVTIEPPTVIPEEQTARNAGAVTPAGRTPSPSANSAKATPIPPSGTPLFQAEAGPSSSSDYVTPSPAPKAGVNQPPPPQKSGQLPKASPHYHGGQRVLDEGRMRKVSHRLFHGGSSHERTNDASATREERSQPERTGTGEGTADSSRDGFQSAFSLISTLSSSYRSLCMFRCHEALQWFETLPVNQYKTGWVLHHVALAYAEMLHYRQARSVFQEMRKVAPERLEGLEMYSTVLWHLRDESELSFLAQDAISLDRWAPEAWCIAGNCFSLQRDHKTATKMLKRAKQVDKHFTYSHTLLGHEHFANDMLDGALSSFRAALKVDKRHYNALYGLGIVYYRQEKYKLAETHFIKALDVNPRSSVLYCYLGMALHALNEVDDALKSFNQAIELDTNNHLAKFERANVLLTKCELLAAREELEMLKEAAPQEPSVYKLLGAVEKQRGDTQAAIHFFYSALDVKPTASEQNAIKTELERLEHGESMD